MNDEKFKQPESPRDIFFDLLLIHSQSKRRLSFEKRLEVGHKNFTMFCMFYGLNGDNKRYSYAEIGKQFNTATPSVYTIINYIWDRLKKANSPFTKEDLCEKIHLSHDRVTKPCS